MRDGRGRAQTQPERRLQIGPYDRTVEERNRLQAGVGDRETADDEPGERGTSTAWLRRAVGRRSRVTRRCPAGARRSAPAADAERSDVRSPNGTSAEPERFGPRVDASPEHRLSPVVDHEEL